MARAEGGKDFPAASPPQALSPAAAAGSARVPCAPAEHLSLAGGHTHVRGLGTVLAGSGAVLRRGAGPGAGGDLRQRWLLADGRTRRECMPGRGAPETARQLGGAGGRGVHRGAGGASRDPGLLRGAGGASGAGGLHRGAVGAAAAARSKITEPGASADSRGLPDHRSLH